jgi:ADP-ribose pyrophosphatase YjhB (NUDIX family)
MHWIERHILKQLAFNDTMRYSELKPDAVEGNLFQYHARVLEKQSLISRSDEGYSLTAKGKVFVADLSQMKQMGVRKLPRAVVMIACKNDAKEYLLFKWRRQPYRGMVSLPFGRQFYGEPLDWVASEQLRLKTGYQAQLKFIGQVDSITTHESGDAIDHLAISVFEASGLTHVETPDGLTGEAFWAHPGMLDSGNCLTGFREIITWLEDPGRAPLLKVSGRR